MVPTTRIVTDVYYQSHKRALNTQIFTKGVGDSCLSENKLSHVEFELKLQLITWPLGLQMNIYTGLI